MDVKCSIDLQKESLFATCSDIINGVLLSALLYVFLTLNIVSNTVTFLWQLSSPRPTTAVLQCFISAADFIIGIYVLIILIFDHI